MKFQFLALLLSVNVFSVDAFATTKIVITGSSTVAPLINEIGKRFESKNSGVRIDVQTGGSSRGIADTRQGIAQIGMISRNLKTDETDLNGFVLAQDGITMILHKNNPVTALDDAQIISIYKGIIKNWKDVGGVDAPITVVNKAEGRSTLELFLQYFKLNNSEIKASVVIGDNEQGIKTVAGNPNAIGFVSIGTAEANMKLGTQIKALPMGKVAATTENLANGKFPFSRQLLLITKAAPTGLEKKFIDFCLSQDVVDLIEQQYFVPIKRPVKK